MTRRTLIRLLPGACAGPLLAAGSMRQERRYRADAVITFLGMKIYSRAGVGSGYALLEESASAAPRTFGLGFAGGSWPERAKGLNRLGFIQEQVVEQNSSVREARYFGFMTSSPEESLEEAKRSVDHARGEVPISAILGSMIPGHYQSTVARLQVEPALNWGNWRPFLPRVRQAFGGKSQRSSVVDSPGATSQPFLYTLMSAIHSKQSRGDYRFGYGGQMHTLSVENEADDPTGTRMKSIGLAREPRDVRRLAGTIRNSTTQKQTKFRVWFDATSSGLPLRIEFQPRSFLRLVFEADASLPGFDFPELPPK